MIQLEQIRHFRKGCILWGNLPALKNGTILWSFQFQSVKFIEWIERKNLGGKMSHAYISLKYGWIKIKYLLSRWSGYRLSPQRKGTKSELPCIVATPFWSGAENKTPCKSEMLSTEVLKLLQFCLLSTPGRAPALPPPTLLVPWNASSLALCQWRS